MIRTIRAKFMVGFFLIFSVFFLILNQMVASNLEAGNRRIMTENLIDLKKNSSAYIRQSFLIRHFASDELYLEQMAGELAADLQRDTSSEVAFYDLKSRLLYSTDTAAFAPDGDDLKQALGGRTAYTLTHANGTASVAFAYPVTVDGVKVGIVRYAKDFSLLYEQSGHIQRTIFAITLAVFAAAFLFSYLLSRHITVPLVKLTKASTEVMNGNLHIRLNVGRKDEIGQLSANFTRMIERIRQQISRIESDRDRLEEAGLQRKRFYDNVTHELKTPLTTIMGYAEIIRKNGMKDPAFFEKGMTHIVDESKRLHDMVLQLLERSQRTSGAAPAETVDAGAVLRDVCETMTIKARRYKITIRCETAEGLFVLGDADRLRQLFINLIDNAIKYGYAHTEIRADADLDAAGAVRFRIANRGDTISAEQLRRIFEPFYRAGGGTDEKESAGLGLGICKEIVDEHRGSMEIASREGETTVTIDMPVRPAEEMP